MAVNSRSGDLLELAILGVLADGHQHGYSIRKRLAGFAPQFQCLSFGSLYPALSRLERQGAIEVVAGFESGGADLAVSAPSLRADRLLLRGKLAGIQNHRSKKVFRLTSRGREALDALLMDPDGANDDLGFRIRLMLGPVMPQNAWPVLLDARRQVLLARRAALAKSPAASDPYARCLADLDGRGIATELEWLSALRQADLKALSSR